MMNGRFAARCPSGRYLWIAAGPLLLLAAQLSALLTMHGEPDSLSDFVMLSLRLGFIGFALVACYILWRAAKVNDPAVVIDGSGLEDHRLSVGPVAWSNVREIQVIAKATGLRRGRYLSVVLKEPLRLPERAPWLHQMFSPDPYTGTAGRILIAFDALQPTLDLAIAAIRELHPEITIDALPRPFAPDECGKAAKGGDGEADAPAK